MYEQAYKDIGKGLRLVFFGEILVTVASMFSWSVLSLAGLVLTLVGLSSAGRGDSGYRKAFAVTILTLAVTFAGGILAGVLLVFLPTLALAVLIGMILMVLISVFNFLSTYYICTTSSALLAEREPSLSKQAESLWKVMGACIVVNTVFNFVLMLPFAATAILAGGLNFLTYLVQAAAGILYLIFLYKASDVFQNW